ncbi:HlyD family efflux transporter periplasmic adaptor subunit [candidate division KSB1 bacterium]|nr:HlyD family efflux transporter periplasmic adaptor subunit [candidate division KSB1 bacterium]
MRLRRLEQNTATEVYDQGELIVARNIHQAPLNKKRLWMVIIGIFGVSWLTIYLMQKGTIETKGTLTIPVVEISTPANAELIGVFGIEGDPVTIQDTLIIIRENTTITLTRPDSIAASQKELLLKEAAIGVSLARKELNRKERLFELDLIVGQDVENARAEYELAVARLQKQRAELVEKETRTARPIESPIKIIRAPATGMIGQVFKTKGEVVRAGEIIMTLLDTQHPWIETKVEEEYLDRLFIGQTTTIKPIIPNSIEYYGHVTGIGAVVNVVSEMNQNGQIVEERGVVVKILTQLSNLESFKPGSSMKIKFHRR